MTRLELRGWKEDEWECQIKSLPAALVEESLIQSRRNDVGRRAGRIGRSGFSKPLIQRRLHLAATLAAQY